MRTEVTGDLFNIGKRLKEIDPVYRIYRNNREDRYEVHNSNRPDVMSLCFAVPYPELDERVLDHARKTRKQNYDAIEAELNAHNAEIEHSAQKSMRTATAELGDMFEYALRAGHPVTFTKPAKWF